MGPEEFKNLSGRASKFNSWEVDRNFLKDGYDIEQGQDTATDTGLLELLKVIRRDGKGPDFSARWDHRTDKLKFDMSNASRTAISKFKKGVDGYAGHHAKKSTALNTRTFEIKICAAGEDFFVGTASFSLTFDMIMKEEAKVAGTLDATWDRSR
jgi:hypothetical protein